MRHTENPIQAFSGILRDIQQYADMFKDTLYLSN